MTTHHGARDGTEAIGRLRLGNGLGLTDARLHYRTLGTRRHDGAGTTVNGVLLLHGTTGSGEQFLQPGFADAMFGPGQPLDLERWFVVVPDALGHGKSSKPSDGLYADFPAYGYHDMVEAQRLLLDRLELPHLRLIFGTSMGGMQTWMWAGLHPLRMDALVAIACEPAPVTGRNLLWRRLITRAIRADAGWQRREWSTPPAGFVATWPLFSLMTSTPRRLAELAEPSQAVQYLDAQSADAPDATDMLYALEASGDYDPRPLLPAIQAPLLAINFADDELNPPELHELEQALPQARTARALTIPAGPRTAGHQTLHHAEVYAGDVAAFLEEQTIRPTATADPLPREGRR